ncbi:hypothetical protein PSACC_02808 [Paramicrosporidium saccamoebae]|uniref:BRO domain-containing protein 1 n=1 Tax=Paramicrosporidium saccamoebae TaxID=1246581 RepID=A0A2H9THW8_9FUNG|nr:hypothetical protein PSACC_02808 [Paramicrosporidium saccamoebae]
MEHLTSMAASASEELVTLDAASLGPPAVVLATAGYDHTIRFWDVVRSSCIGTLQHNESQANCMALTRDKLRLAVGGNPAIRLFDTVAATQLTEEGVVNTTANVPPLHVFEGHIGNVVALGFHTDGDWLWSASEDGTVRIWDITSPEYLCQREISLGCTITSAAISPSQTELYVADQNGRVRVWDLASNTSLLEQYVEEGVQLRCISLSQDGNHMACIDHAGRLHLWRIAVTTAEDEDATLLSLHHLCTVQAHEQYGLKCLFSPDSSFILTTSSDSTARLWRITDPRLLTGSNGSLNRSFTELSEPQVLLELAQTFEGHSKWVWDCAFSADSAYVVTTSSDNTARLWDGSDLEVMQAVPLKKSLPVSFKALGTYIETGHHQDPEEYEVELKKLDDLRQAAINAVPSAEGLARLAEYHGQLSKLSTRFPIGEDGIKIAFSWFNFAGKEKKPKASIIVNIGATYSQMAAQESYGSVDGLKRAYNNFLNAAGAFESAGRCASGAPIPTTDLCESSISCLVAMMLAQAQECFVQKAILEKAVKDTTLAKLAMSTSAFFESAKSHVSKNSATGMFANYVDWLAGKAALYRGIAHYRKSTECLVASQYGREIVKLQEADEAVRDAKELIKRLPSELSNQITALAVSVTKNLERALKDNSLIYNDPLPARGAWGDCGAAVIVKATAFPDAAISSYTTAPCLFERLPVIHVSRILNSLAVTRDQIVSEQLVRLDAAVSTLEGAFTKHQLPGVVHSVLSPEGLPEALIAQSDEIREKGGFTALEEIREKVQNLRTDCSKIVNATTCTLDDEEAQDNNNRQRYGPQWTRALSSQLNKMLRGRLDELRMTLKQGEAADASFIEIYNEHIPSIISLSLSKEDLEDAVPASSSRNLGIPAAVVGEITAAIERKDHLIGCRNSLGEELGSAIGSVDIVARALELDGESDIEAVISKELRDAAESIGPKLDRLDSDIAEYLRFLERLMADFYESCPKIQTSMDERGVAFQRLNEAYNAYLALMPQLGAGQQFYTDLLEQLRSLQQVCADFAQNRLGELQEMSSQQPSAAQYPTQQPPVPGAWNPSIPVRYGAPQNVSPASYGAPDQGNPYPVVYPSGAHQPGAYPPGTYPPGAYPPGAYPPNNGPFGYQNPYYRPQ